MRKYVFAHSFLMISSAFAYPSFFIVHRQGLVPGLGAATTAPQSSAQTAPSTSASSQTTTTPTALSSTTSASLTSATPSVSSTTITSPTTSSTPPSTTSSASSSSSSPSSSTSETPTTSAIISTNSLGSPTTVIVSETPSTTSSPSPSATSPPDSSIHSSTIVGLSVAGGIAALAVISFIIWKLTRKRFSDLDDADEAIKWPELSRESQTDGGGGLSHQLSHPYPNEAPSRNASALDHSDTPDPYAVPPLPQFNPNQPYRDDPYAASNAGYYDPYRGPIPQTFHDGSMDGHENIPMSTYPLGSQSRNPGPGIAYDMGGRGSPTPGRASPALGQAYDMGGRGSPALGRTVSPGPAAALGQDRRPTPGQYPFSGPPEMATRTTANPGPNFLG